MKTMNVLMSITEGDKTITIDADVEGSLSEVADMVTSTVSAAFGYPVECVLVTSEASFDKDGFVQ